MMQYTTARALGQARFADLHTQAQRDALARAAARAAGRTAIRQASDYRQPHRRQRRFGQQLWTLLHAQALLGGPATVPHQSVTCTPRPPA